MILMGPLPEVPLKVTIIDSLLLAVAKSPASLASHWLPLGLGKLELAPLKKNRTKVVGDCIWWS